jgi:subtilisin family serine protease
MPAIDARKLKLKPQKLPPVKKEAKSRAQDQNGVGENAAPKGLQYDPHLQEEKRRADLKQRSTFRANWENPNKPRIADVIVRLKNFDDKPKDLHIVKHIGNGIVTGTVAVKKIEDLRPQVASLKAATDLYLDLYNSVPAVHCDPESLDQGAPSFPGLDGSGVLIGIVDVGCDFRHKNFRTASGATRIRFLWDQSKDADPKNGDPARSPDYGYGRELDADLINKALKAEDTAYKTLGYMPTANAHGTHVMDIAAGNGRELARFGGKDGPIAVQPSHPGLAPNAQIIFVHLKTFEGGELGNSRHLLEAVDYIFRKADALNMPAVVNLSVSTSGGPHDGKTLAELGFEALVNAKPGRAIVTSAGNSYQKQGHLSGALQPGESKTILWHTDPRHADPETTKNEMEIWYGEGQTLDLTLYAPGGRRLGSVGLGKISDVNEGERRVGRVSHRYCDPNNYANQIDIRVPHIDDRPWKIELSAKAAEVGENGSATGKKRPGIEFHAWIEQADQGLSRFDGETDPLYTLGSISCSSSTLTVGAFDTAERACLARPFEATSAGPTRQVPLGDAKKKAKRDKPDLSAPGVNIVAAAARGGVTVLSGTSMAAAHVTGLVALVFQLALRSGKGWLPFSDLRQILIGGVVSPDPDPFHPNLYQQLGAGRINGTNCMKKGLGLKAASPAPDSPTSGSPTPGSPGAGSTNPGPLNPSAIAIELHPDPDPSSFRPDAPPAKGPEPTVSAVEEPSPQNPQDFCAVIAQLKGHLYLHSNNGSADLASLINFMQMQIDQRKGFRLSVEPLS